MGFLETRFSDHPVWSSVDQARSLMNASTPPSSPAELEALAYAGAVLELLEKRRTDTDQPLVSASMLQALHASVDTFTTQMNNVLSGAWAWTDMIPPTDGVVTTLAQWPPLRPARYLSGVAAAVQRFESQVARALNDAAEASAQASARVAEAAAQATTAAADATGEATRTMAASLAAVEQRHIELNASQAELANQITQERQRISEEIATFRNTSAEVLRAIKIESADERGESHELWAGLLREQMLQADEHNATMAAHLEKSKKVLEAVGVNATATDYGAYANQQGKTADAWRWIASVVFTLAGAWFVYTSLHSVEAGTASWQTSLAKLGVTAAVAGVGAYAARESSQHRRNEREARRTQLVLTALEPFIANMPEERQEDLRAESARSIFVLQPEKVPRDEAASGSPWFDIIRGLISKLPDSKP